jgi:hypothetical protein
MKKALIVLAMISFTPGKGQAQDLPTSRIMIVEGLRSLVQGFYQDMRRDQGRKTPLRIVTLFGKSLLKSIPSGVLKGYAVEVANKEGMMPLGLLLYRKGELVPNQNKKAMLFDWRIRYSFLEIGTTSRVSFHPGHFVDLASVIGYGYLTDQNMRMNIEQSLYAGKPIFGKRFNRWYAISPSPAVLGY